MGVGMMQSKRRILLNEPHLVTTASAALHTFSTNMVAPLKECKVHFSPVQAGSGDPAPDNVRPITGWTGITVNRNGKNFIVSDEPNNPMTNYTHSSTGRVEYSSEEEAFYSVGLGVAYAKHAGVANRFFIAPDDMTVTVSVDYKNVDTDYGIRFFKNDTRITDIHGNKDAIWHRWERTFELLEGNYFKLTVYGGIYFRNWQIEIANSATEYEPYQGITIPIDWTTEAGTVYGGYVDLCAGKVFATKGRIVYTGNGGNWSVQNTISGWKNFYIKAPSNAQSSQFEGKLFCNLAKPAISQPEYTKDNCMISSGGYVNFALGDTLNISTVNDWNYWLTTNNIELIYDLKTNVEYTIDPVILKTLRGLNNIWSSANSNIELSYWTH